MSAYLKILQCLSKFFFFKLMMALQNKNDITNIDPWFVYLSIDGDKREKMSRRYMNIKTTVFIIFAILEIITII